MGGLVRHLLPTPGQPTLLLPAPEAPAPSDAVVEPAERPKRRGRAASILTGEEGLPERSLVGRKLLLGQ